MTLTRECRSSGRARVAVRALIRASRRSERGPHTGRSDRAWLSPSGRAVSVRLKYRGQQQLGFDVDLLLRTVLQ